MSVSLPTHRADSIQALGVTGSAAAFGRLRIPMHGP